MKKPVFSFLLVALYCPFAFADGASASRVLPATGTGAVSPVVSDDNARMSRVADNGVARTNSVISRGVVSADNNTSSGATSAITTRSGARTVTVENGSVSSGRSGSGAVRSRGQNSATSTRSALSNTVDTVGRNSRVTDASMNKNPVIRRAGVSLRPSTAEVGGRATIAGTNGIQTGSNIGAQVRATQSRATTVATRESISEAKERLEQTADLNKSCQEQYNDCMDQFCAVIDANQKRCSCSANLANYTKTETAVKDANTKLNDVAQRIRYVGLSADEITAIMKETEAEAALSGKADTSETRNMLAQIEKMIKNPGDMSSYTDDTDFGLDINLDFSSDTADIFNLDFLTGNSSNSFSNLRGRDLYNAAKKRCTVILNQCKGAGATVQQITGNYDLAIDKDCIAYEQGLKKMNETLVSNVRSANLMLQKARLSVMKNKNQYDAKECVSALDACMTDEMVCGENYVKCLDPTKRYIDENGAVVLGRDITDISAFMDLYNNATVDANYLAEALNNTVPTVDNCVKQCVEEYSSDSGNTNTTQTWALTSLRQDGISCTAGTCIIPPGFNTGAWGTGGRLSTSTTTNACKVYKGGTGTCVANYLLNKMGTGARATDGGLCRAVLDKCQAYTYDSNGNYNPYNDIVIHYIQRAMVNINAAQRKIISDYSSTCIKDVATCLNKQANQIGTWTSSKTDDSVYKIMKDACYNVSLTCAAAVFAYDSASCPGVDVSTDANKCIYNLSKVIYQNQFCPANSAFESDTAQSVSANNTHAGYVNSHCKCDTGYVVYNGECRPDCGELSIYGFDGKCTCVDNAETAAGGGCKCTDAYYNNNGVCEKKCDTANDKLCNSTGDGCNKLAELKDGTCSCVSGAEQSPADANECKCQTDYVEINGICIVVRPNINPRS